MLLYNVRIGLKSLRRNPILTAIIIGAIALGICISTAATTLRHVFAKNPLPGKSERVFYVRLDNWDPTAPHPHDDALPPQVTFRDATELMRSTIPVRQTASFQSSAFIFPESKDTQPTNEKLRVVGSDFFPMFNVPFKYGSGWDKKADAASDQVTVLNAATNDRLFGGANSVGKTLRIEDRHLKIVGVLAPWRPNVRFYDLTGQYISEPEAIYVPFSLVGPMQLPTGGNSDGWKSSGDTFDDFLQSESSWIQFWVELDSPGRQQEYLEYVNSYVQDQKRLGRFQRPLNNRVTSLTQLMKDWKVVPPQLNAMTVVSILFLTVCSLNLVGLLLGKFLARAPEVSVRRALGASRWSVFLQHIIECELVGIIGGVLGVLLSLGILNFAEKIFPVKLEARLDGEMILVAAFLSLVAGLVAGIYPAWRICAIQPAMQLKVQ